MDQEVTVTKPPVDVKHYRYIVLSNSIKALLISDPRIDCTSGAYLTQCCLLPCLLPSAVSARHCVVNTLRK